MNKKNILLNLTIFLQIIHVCIGMENDSGSTAKEFRQACMNNNYEEIQRLILNGQNVDEIIQFSDHPEKMSVLSYACYKKNTSLATFLINQGADIHGKTGPKTAPLTFASYLNKEEVNHKLIIPFSTQQELLTIIQNKIKEQSLLYACAQNDLMTARLYIHLANHTITDQLGRTPLMMACYHKNLALINLLLKNGADANKRDKDGHSAIFYASFKQSPIAITTTRPIKKQATYSSEGLNCVNLLLTHATLKKNLADLMIIKYIFGL